MHTTLITIASKLNALASHIQSTVPNDEPWGNAHNAWNLPGLTRVELVEETQALAWLIEERGKEDIGAAETRLNDYVRRLEHLRAHTVGQFWGGNGGQAASVYMLTLDALRRALVPALQEDEPAKAAATLRKLTTQLRGMEARLTALDPRTTTLGGMVERIEKAYNAADQLPADLESLSEARASVEELLRLATGDQGELVRIVGAAKDRDDDLKGIADQAAAVLEKCERAYSASTSVGLAAAFSERSKSLSWSMWVWVGGLVAALGLGSVFGTNQLRSLTDLLKTPGAELTVIVLNLLLAMLSVAAPVWFAWLATKQIGQRFRLAEDYAFKASISRAYEGYRQEAHRIDEDLEARLLESALTRLDEQPLRLVEGDSHGSPWHELASSDLVKEAMRAVPGFAGQIRELAAKAVSAATPRTAKSAATSAVDNAE